LELGENIKNRAQDSKSLGVSMQSNLRDASDENYYVEPYLWTGIGLARSGCGAAIVGNPDQVYNKLKSYMEMGIHAFILSGYPHQQECELFAKYVLPRLKNIHLPEVLGRVPKTIPNTPLGNGSRA
jgi:alkanesulfonate monooxygenase